MEHDSPDGIDRPIPHMTPVPPDQGPSSAERRRRVGRTIWLVVLALLLLGVAFVGCVLALVWRLADSAPF